MKTFIAGSLFGFFATPFGLLIGLQFSSLLGNLCLLPVLPIIKFSGVAIGDMPGPLRIAIWMIASLFWGALFVLFKNVLRMLLVKNVGTTRTATE